MEPNPLLAGVHPSDHQSSRLNQKRSALCTRIPPPSHFRPDFAPPTSLPRSHNVNAFAISPYMPSPHVSLNSPQQSKSAKSDNPSGMGKMDIWSLLNATLPKQTQSDPPESSRKRRRRHSRDIEDGRREEKAPVPDTTFHPWHPAVTVASSSAQNDHVPEQSRQSTTSAALSGSVTGPVPSAFDGMKLAPRPSLLSRPTDGLAYDLHFESGLGCLPSGSAIIRNRSAVDANDSDFKHTSKRLINLSDANGVYNPNGTTLNGGKPQEHSEVQPEEEQSKRGGEPAASREQDELDSFEASGAKQSGDKSGRKIHEEAIGSTPGEQPALVSWTRASPADADTPIPRQTLPVSTAPQPAGADLLCHGIMDVPSGSHSRTNGSLPTKDKKRIDLSAAYVGIMSAEAVTSGETSYQGSSIVDHSVESEHISEAKEQEDDFDATGPETETLKAGCTSSKPTRSMSASSLSSLLGSSTDILSKGNDEEDDVIVVGTSEISPTRVKRRIAISEQTSPARRSRRATKRVNYDVLAAFADLDSELQPSSPKVRERSRRKTSEKQVASLDSSPIVIEEVDPAGSTVVQDSSLGENPDIQVAQFGPSIDLQPESCSTRRKRKFPTKYKDFTSLAEASNPSRSGASSPEKGDRPDRPKRAIEKKMSEKLSGLDPSESVQHPGCNEISMEEIPTPMLQAMKNMEKAKAGTNASLQVDPATATAGSEEGAVERQSGSCLTQRYSKFAKCAACVGRKTGDMCRFQGLRMFREPFFGNSQDDSVPLYSPPLKYNVPLGDDHIHKTKKAVVPGLIPLIARELNHVSLPGIIHKAPGEPDARSLCDLCATTIFGGSWYCKRCGREYCLACRSYFDPATPPEAETPAASQAALVRLKRCFFRPAMDHSPDDLIPISIYTRAYLDREWRSLLQFAEQEGMDAEALLLGAKLGTTEGSGRPFNTRQRVQARTRIRGISSDQTCVGGVGESLYTRFTRLEQPRDESGLPSHSFMQIALSALDNTTFDILWGRGEPLVVNGVENSFRLDWTAPAFIDRVKGEICSIQDCQTNAITSGVRTSEFFRQFQRQADERDQNFRGVLKLKDWPPTEEFRDRFPDLFEDFSQAVPAADFTRRDAAYNIYAHWPSNRSAPDLGPKMYNAFAAQERPGGSGSTRLHMDMADAVNVLLHSNALPGQPNTDCAAWDIFRAEDADKIRQFLKSNNPKRLGFVDPIHSQLFYLDNLSRRELYEQTGVYSFRIYQYPGQAVFIPAGCAHQVSNVGDCIKIAVDFVSPHNVMRCDKLMREFRGENFAKAWKEDVLQLNNALWFAWLACTHHERLRKKGQSREHPSKLNGNGDASKRSQTFADTDSDLSPIDDSSDDVL